MKKNILTSIGLTAFFAVGIISLNVVSDSGTTSVYAGSSNITGSRTGSPGDASNCTLCHNDGAINAGPGAVTITSSIPASGYVAGQTYTITATITEASINKFGFQLAVEKVAGNGKTGILLLSDAVRTQFGQGNLSVSHTSAGTSPSASGISTWPVDWIAPLAGTGDVTIYAAFSATDNDATNQGDHIYTQSLPATEDISTSLAENSNVIATTIFPNPVKNSFEIITSKIIENVVVYNLAGKKMSGVNQTANKFDVSRLSAGIYFVQFESDGEVITKKVIKD